MMAKGHRRRRREASLTDPSTVAGSTGRGRLAKLEPSFGHRTDRLASLPMAGRRRVGGACGPANSVT
jgi:hypothetical protein